MEGNDDSTSEWTLPEPLVFDGMALPSFPPFLKDARKRFEDIKNLACRKDDVILVTYPKSGTHWVWEIVSMLLKQKAEYSKEPKECFFLEILPDLTVVQSMPSPRQLNTHMPYRWLPIQHIQNGGKIVHVMRNPKDVCVSMYHHAKTTMEFGELRDFGTFFDKLFLNPKAHIMDGWFKYEKDFEQAEKEDKLGAILSLHYESLKKDPIQETRRLAEFLNVKLTEEDIAEISDKCSFQKLRLANKTIKDHSWISPDMPNRERAHELVTKKMFRKGMIGDWKNHFTVAMNEEFDAVYKEEMKDSNIQVQFE
uniref:Estrogen sulfotransferase-like n=1 Tax=Crassostrea virginica TaxID=6565 RepID=A0A8B8EHG6_CRAVI|nr:estrogen sulfotransferase-like [Crassostrea virginica]